jgi:hypothetical protein
MPTQNYPYPYPYIKRNTASWAFQVNNGTGCHQVLFLPRTFRAMGVPTVVLLGKEVAILEASTCGSIY